jgi:hypothetical protein
VLYFFYKIYNLLVPGLIVETPTSQRILGGGGGGDGDENFLMH